MPTPCSLRYLPLASLHPPRIHIPPFKTYSETQLWTIFKNRYSPLRSKLAQHINTRICSLVLGQMRARGLDGLCRLNKQKRVINAASTSHKHSNKDPNRLHMSLAYVSKKKVHNTHKRYIFKNSVSLSWCKIISAYHAPLKKVFSLLKQPLWVVGR